MTSGRAEIEELGKYTTDAAICHESADAFGSGESFTSRSDLSAGKQFQPLTDAVRIQAVMLDQFICGSAGNGGARHQCDKGEHIGLGLDTRVTDAAEPGSRICSRRMNKEMTEFVKHREEFPIRRQVAVYGDVVFAQSAKIHAGSVERSFIDKDVKSLTERVKIGFCEWTFVPADIKAFYFFEQEFHGCGNVLQMQHYPIIEHHVKFSPVARSFFPEHAVKYTLCIANGLGFFF